MRERVVELELHTQPDDVGLGRCCSEEDQKRPSTPARVASVARRSNAPRIGAAIRITRIVERVHADDDGFGLHHLGPSQREKGRSYCRAGTYVEGMPVERAIGRSESFIPHER